MQNVTTTTRTDASIATDKNTIATTSTSLASKPIRSDDEKSLDDIDGVDDTDDNNKYLYEYEPMSEFTPPLRINASRVPERLTGSTSSLNIPSGLQTQLRRRKSDSAVMTRSGSRSPAAMNYDGGSSLSSVEDGIDPDILTDKMGFLDLDLKDPQPSRDLNSSRSNLPPVTERMSEGTLEDCHAFTDVRSGNISRGNSITTGGEVSSNVLEPLDECEDEDEHEGGRVLVTNMEEILEVAEEDYHESPSLPTA